MDLGDSAARGPNPLYLFVERPLCVAPELGRLLLGLGVERRQVFSDVHDVQFGARSLAELYRRLGGERGIRGPIGGQ
jgi:hypothetical protein